jgi:murein L,D-transpeptidase YafK
MRPIFLLLPGLLCAAESPEFMEELHAWEAEMARPGVPAARALPDEVRAILALEPSERDPVQLAAVAGFYRGLKTDRVAAARKARGATIRQRFADAGLAYPPREIFFRAFKREMELELWARDKDEPFRKVTAFAVTAPSGGPGPKRREGDLQVPEGCYVINVFNPKSRFHLSLGLNYPNASDRVLSDRAKPGGEIYIHGGAASIGCLPLGDPAIEEVYLAALDARARGQSEIPVHIFPARMTGAGWKEFVEQKPEYRAFWSDLQPIHDAFEQTQRVPRFTVAADGRYRLSK